MTNVIRCEISDDEIFNLDGEIPLNVRVRMLLNKKGLKFQDNGKASCAINEKLIPLGIVRRVYDAKAMATRYEQVFD